jgi:ribosomal protein L29
MSKNIYSTKSQEELQNILSDKKIELGKLVFVKNDPSQKTNSASLKTLRKDISRIKTLLNQSSK